MSAGKLLVFPLTNVARKKNYAGLIEPEVIDLKRAVSALFDASGEIAPIDAARFGRRAGEIIARAANQNGKSNPPELTARRRSRRQGDL